MRQGVDRWLRISCAAMVVAACGDDGPTNNNGSNNTVALTARHGHAMAYDEARRQLLLFGGVGTEGNLGSGDRASTWRWDGSTWTRIATTGPSARSRAAVAYDATRQRVVLFGGESGTFPNITMSRDTWEWDGTGWTQRATTGPSARMHQTMAFDRARGRVVLFGGFDPATQQELRDIWEWDGTAWTQSSISGAANTIALGVAHDEKAAATYLYSIPQSGGAPVASRWNGTALTSAAAAAPPCALVHRQFAALGSNPGGFLFYVHACSQSGTPIAPQSWRFDGTTWTQIAGTQPPLRYNSAMAYDRDRNRVVLYGGEVAQGVPDLADTWEFDGTAWTRR